MEGAVCPNRKCTAAVDVALHNCPKCDMGISPRHRNAFVEAMALTKSHMENMKDVACKL